MESQKVLIVDFFNVDKFMPQIDPAIPASQSPLLIQQLIGHGVVDVIESACQGAVSDVPEIEEVHHHLVQIRSV